MFPQLSRFIDLGLLLLLIDKQKHSMDSRGHYSRSELLSLLIDDSHRALSRTRCAAEVRC